MFTGQCFNHKNVLFSTFLCEFSFFFCLLRGFTSRLCSFLSKPLSYFSFFTIEK